MSMPAMTFRPASRLAHLKPSPIRIISEGASPEAIPLGLGEPTWDLPEPARRALAATAGPASYGPNMGLPELRQALACWHIARTEEVLVTVEQVADIRVTNGNTGKVFMVGSQEEKKQILEAYAALDIRPEEELERRIGYSYRIQLLDADGNVLQNVTPYKDAVTLDGEIYDGSMNQTTTALLLAVSAAREG